MSGSLPPGRKEDEITRRWCFGPPESPGGLELVKAVARQTHPLLGENLLDKGRAIEAEWRPSAPMVGHTKEAPDPCHEPGHHFPRHQGPVPHPASAPVGKLDLAVASLAPDCDHPAIEEQRAHQRSSTPAGPDFDSGYCHASGRLPSPGTRTAARGEDQPPPTHPSPVAVGEILDLPPLPVGAGAEHPDNLPEQELAREFGPVVWTAPHVQGGQGDNCVRGAGHSKAGLVRTKRPKPSRSSKTKRR